MELKSDLEKVIQYPQLFRKKKFYTIHGSKKQPKRKYKIY